MNRAKDVVTGQTRRGQELPLNKSVPRLFLSLAVLLLLANQCASVPKVEKAFHKAPEALSSPYSADQVHLSDVYGKIPMNFEPNVGQTDAAVKFLSRGTNHTLFLTSDEAIWVSNRPIRQEGTLGEISHQQEASKASKLQHEETAFLRMRVIGANSEVKVSGEGELPGKSNYFVGNDPEAWRTNVPHYARVQYAGVYPGIDLVFRGDLRQLEYDFLVAPGADPGAITVGFEGIERLELDAQGNLVLHYAGGSIRQRRPVIYQDNEGTHREVAGGFVLKGRHQIGFQVAAYDASKTLVIDPALLYSTYLGGTGSDAGHQIAVDVSGNAYVTGNTTTHNFPTPGSMLGSGGALDVFVAKLNAAGTALVYLTYLGGSSSESTGGIALDGSGNAYVTGETYSNDFPTTVDAHQRTLAGATDAFVAKLNASGTALVYSTYLGGSGSGVSGTDRGQGIAVDSSGNAYVTGETSSLSFPTTLSAFQSTYGGGNGDAFVTRLNSGASALVYSTYLGGNDFEEGLGITVDTSGNAYLTGETFSTNFPVTTGAFQPTYPGGSTSAFVTKVNPSGSALAYSTYLGSGMGVSIAIDASGNAYTTGEAGSPFPTTAGSFQPTCTLNEYGTCQVTAFITKLSASGTSLVYSSYLGQLRADGEDTGRGVAVDETGAAYVTGYTSSSFFPTRAPVQLNLAGQDDAFVAKVNPEGSTLVWSTYLGGTGRDAGRGIAINNGGGNIYVVGSTTSRDFPITANAFQPIHGGSPLEENYDVFVTLISPIVAGDLDGNGLPGLEDAILAAKILTGIEQTATIHRAADASADDRIGIEEALYALQTAARLRNYPVLNPIGSKSVDEGGSLVFMITGSDPEGDVLTFSALNLPAGAEFQPLTRTFSWSPTYSQSGIYQVTFTVTDIGGYSDSETVTISVNNVLAMEGWQYTLDGGQGSGNLTFTEQQGGSIRVDANWTYYFYGAPATGSFTNGTATIAGTAVSFSGAGTATHPYAPPSPFTMYVDFTSNDGTGSGTYTINFSTYGWPPSLSGTVVATRTSGGGITK